jgi:hypothetical protein
VMLVRILDVQPNFRVVRRGQLAVRTPRGAHCILLFRRTTVAETNQ